MKRLILGISMATILVAGMSTQSLAVSLSGVCSGQENNLGFCEKTVTLVGSQLTIELKNTSPAANTGYITADAFDLNAGTTLSNFTTTNSNFSLFTAGPYSVAPDGFRQFLISSTSDDWTGGGNPTGGVAEGDTVIWGLTLGGDVSGITPESLFGSERIRFRGFADGGSDKTGTTPGTPGNPIPEPGTILLFGSGLAGLGLWRWKAAQKS